MSDFSWDDFNKRGQAVMPAPGPASPIIDLGNAHEIATDLEATKRDEEAAAENAYDEAFSEAWAQASDIAATARKTHCDTQPKVLAAKKAWTTAVSARKNASALAHSIELRHTGAMSYQKHHAAMDGGSR